MGLSSLTLYLGYALFFKNHTNKIFPPPQIASQDSKSNKVRSSINNDETATETDAVNFAPAKETLLINNALSFSAVALNNDTKEILKPQSANYGLTEGVDPKANAQVASVAEALKNTKFAERLSPLIQPKPFDRAQFEKDPQAYLNVIEPGRVFQTKNPDQEVVVIQRISEPFVTIQQNDKTILKVKALPLMPVTFTSFDLGAFQNKLTSITVQADKDGFAQATFIGTEGTLADCNILASCPETSGRIKFVISVTKNNLFSQGN